MSEDITVMTWNLNGEGGTSKNTSKAQINFLDNHHEDTDIFLFQAVDYAQDHSEEPSHFQRLEHYFHQRGYKIAHNRDWNRQLHNTNIQPFQNIGPPLKRCKITASKWDIGRNPLDLREMKDRNPDKLNYFYANFPTCILIADIDHPSTDITGNEGLQAWNAGVIYGRGWKEEKANVLETIYAQVYLQNDQTNKKVLLGGDFNAPKEEHRDSEGRIQIDPHKANGREYTDEPFYGDPYRYKPEEETESTELTYTQRYRNAERYIFDPKLTKWDMRDVYWHADNSLEQSSANDYTHEFHQNGVDHKRLDHILADDHFDIKSCEIQNGLNGTANGLGPSDHAPVKTTLEIKN
ncbi:endonuclease/exonuclease/phosphatase family protein [Halococcus sediminicola]|uniref:endonuclease/exonuclease/phosphatase family protein n=1 Tax=Halococcus sediminicola TaxID=1264579 RepID=UPI00067851E1|nr:endonuclease/exonuclease/phosphatase family protein [Halococcus sediminicola]